MSEPTERPESARVRLRPWAETDLELGRAINAPEMMDHLGGPETEQQVSDRHHRYARDTASGAVAMFVIELAAETGPDQPLTVVAAGSIGYWPTRWDEQDVYETGWSVLPAHQGHGLATIAARLVARHVVEHGDRRYLHAFPKLDHPASNAICRKAGFELLGARDFEYPPGHPIHVNDWRLDLAALAPA